MATTRKISIYGSWNPNGPANEWAGSGTVDEYGAVECSAELGADAYDLIEAQIAGGETAGSVDVEDATGRSVTYRWEIEG